MRRRDFDRFIERFDVHIERMDARGRDFDRFIERFDAHVERSDAHSERMDGRQRDFDRFIERFDEHIARMDVEIAETRAVIRESAIRQERALQAFEARLQVVEQEYRESRDERVANTQAIWALLDRWGYGPPPEPA